MICGESTKLFNEEIPISSSSAPARQEMNNFVRKVRLKKRKINEVEEEGGLQCWHFLQKDTQLFLANAIQGRVSLSYKKTLKALLFGSVSVPNKP